MKKWIFLLALLIPSAVFTVDFKSSDIYCSDDSKKVYFVTVNLETYLPSQKLGRGSVVTAELLGEINGKSVLLSCFDGDIIRRDTAIIDTQLVISDNVFIPIQNPKDSSVRAIGINKSNSTVLVEETSLYVLKNFSIHKMRTK